MGRIDHLPRGRRRRQRRSALRWFLVSAAVHLVFGLLLLLLVAFEPYAVPSAEYTEVEVVTQASQGQRPSPRDGEAAEAQRAQRRHDEPLRQRLATTTARPEAPRPRRTATPKTTQPLRVRRRVKRPGKRRPQRRGNAKTVRGPGPVLLKETEGGDLRPSCLLSMRGCGRAEGQSRADRFATFRPRRPSLRRPRRAAAQPSVRARLEHDGLAMTRYADGGRLLQARGKRTRAPGFGEVGLMTLASSKLGSSSGHLACDPYRHRRRGGRRTLVLLVDTSGSITQQGKAPAAIVCAAGAALAALRRGHDVAVANFSSSVWYLRKTRDKNALYSVLSRLQRAKTKLPPATLFAARVAHGRDFILVTDTGIDNLKAVAPGYRRLLASHRNNRALLYVLGEGSKAHVGALKSAGFTPDYVERRMDKSFRRFALSQLEAPLRRAVEKSTSERARKARQKRR